MHIIKTCPINRTLLKEITKANKNNKINCKLCNIHRNSRMFFLENINNSTEITKQTTILSNK